LGSKKKRRAIKKKPKREPKRKREDE